MSINIELYCPHCHSPGIVQNGHKRNGSQNYRCKNCGKRFISDHQKIYRGGLSRIPAVVKIMTVRGNGVRDIRAILNISPGKVLQALGSACHQIKPKKNQYDRLETDGFWTYEGRKTNKVWLIYAYHRESGGTVAYVRGKRDLKTAKKLRKRLQRLGIRYGRIATDSWDSFLRAFREDGRTVGKKHTAGIVRE